MISLSYLQYKNKLEKQVTKILSGKTSILKSTRYINEIHSELKTQTRLAQCRTEINREMSWLFLLSSS